MILKLLGNSKNVNMIIKAPPILRQRSVRMLDEWVGDGTIPPRLGSLRCSAFMPKITNNT